MTLNFVEIFFIFCFVDHVYIFNRFIYKAHLLCKAKSDQCIVDWVPAINLSGLHLVNVVHRQNHVMR